MVKVRDAEQSKMKILQVAERIFARKGFDGARVDEIASEAGVNKALIYYYFKSKKRILEEILKGFSRDFIGLIVQYADDQVDPADLEQMKKMFSQFIPYLEEKKDILRIMVAESIKSSDEDPILFKFMELPVKNEIDSIIKRLKDKGFNIDEQREQMMVTEFFTGLMPMINYVVYKDKWVRYFDVDEDDLRDWFLHAYEITHMSYHKKQQQQ